MGHSAGGKCSNSVDTMANVDTVAMVYGTMGGSAVILCGPQCRWEVQ